MAVTDARETYKVLDLALRIGEILLSSGAGAADVTATMLGITHHLGLRNADIDVTFTLLRMSYQDDPDEMPVLLTRNISQRDIDYDDLTRTHELVNDILDGPGRRRRGTGTRRPGQLHRPLAAAVGRRARLRRRSAAASR